MAQNNNHAEHSSSKLAMTEAGGFQLVPIKHEKQNGVGRALADGPVDKLARELRGQPPAVILQVLGVDQEI